MNAGKQTQNGAKMEPKRCQNGAKLITPYNMVIRPINTGLGRYLQGVWAVIGCYKRC